MRDGEDVQLFIDTGRGQFADIFPIFAFIRHKVDCAR